MPFYEYKCEKCGSVETKLVKLDQSNAPEKCQKSDCEGKPVKIMSASNAKFVGGGFYQTDFKNK